LIEDFWTILGRLRQVDVTRRLAPCPVDALRRAEVGIEEIGCALASLYGARALFDASARSAVLALGSQTFCGAQHPTA
jgi:hypothetical protein